MKMQTVRSILMPEEQTREVTTPVRHLLPPLTAMSLPTPLPAPTPQLTVDEPKRRDQAAQKASEAYLAIMAGVGYRAQLR